MAVTGKEPYTTAYDYDLNNRLKTETKDKGLQIETAEYQYDKNGNQISKTTYVTDGIDSNGGIDLYVVGSQRPLPKRAYTIEHYTYDAFNRLVKVQNDEGTSVYRYKVDGLRLSKDVNGDLTTHVWDGSNIVLEFGAVNDVYLRGINLIKSNQQGYYLFNAHGDVVQRTSDSGALTKSYVYDAFGVESNIDESDSNPFRYCSEYFDSSSGTYYLRQRVYQPNTGRFLTEDSHWNVSNMIYGDNPQRINERQDALGLTIYTYQPDLTAIKQSGNLYGYCIGNPIMFCDPTGNALSWPGEIHLQVSKQIVRNNANFTAERWIQYVVDVPFVGRMLPLAGRIDLVNTETGEIWEIKPSHWNHEAAKNQLWEYTGGLFMNPFLATQMQGKALKIGGSNYNFSSSFEYSFYDVQYWYDGDGIISYSYNINDQRFQQEASSAIAAGATAALILLIEALRAYGIPVPQVNGLAY